MDVVFGKYWLSQCFDAKGESAPAGLSGCRFREKKGNNNCPGQSLDGSRGFLTSGGASSVKSLVGLCQEQKQKPGSMHCVC